MDRSRFCITGLPRSRTAWLTALLCAHGVETLHEYPPFFEDLEALRVWLYEGTPEDPHGYVDGFAIIHHAELLKAHFAEQPIVVIMRDPARVRRSWETREGPISNEVFGGVLDTVNRFWCEAANWANVMPVSYPLLDNYGVVNEMVIHLTGRALKRRTWQLFNVLKIELHQTKCRPLRRAGHLNQPWEVV